MPQFELVLLKEGKSISTYHVGKEGLVIGRASECDVVLPDSMVSRKHARVWMDGTTLKVEDLGARNGIIVNGERVSRLRVDEGDELTVGTHTFRITKATREKKLSDTGAMISFETAGDMFAKMVSEPNSNYLPSLYRAAQLLGSVFDLDVLLNRLLDLIFEAIPARRGFILTQSAENPDPVIRASLPRDASGPPLSTTLIDQAIKDQNAVLTLNAQEEFAGSESVLSYNIQAAMCVPLCGSVSPVGAIYVDSGGEDVVFKNEHLKLLTAIGRVTGVAVENAFLHQEAVERERLAAIGQATAGVGHCVKNILVGIRGGAEFIDLALETEELKYIRKGWPIIRRSVDRIEDLVMNLLTFSRERTHDRAPVDVNLLVAEIVDSVWAHAERAKVKLTFEKHEVGIQQLDSLGIYRAILNLVNNAIDACEEEGGTVTIRTAEDESSLYIEVKDSGVGILDEFLPKLFTAFNSTKGSRGTGLGLACAERIVQDHGGEIRVVSKLDRGSTFTIRLPLQTHLRGT